MKKIIAVIAAVLTALPVLAGCGSKPENIPDERMWPENVIYSNLSDSDSRELLVKLMTEAGIDESKQKTLFEHIDEINGIMEPEELTDGFESRSISGPKYDPYEIQDRWAEKYPDFLGYNCRITAYTLFSDYVDISEDAEVRDSFILMDLDSLAADDSAAPGGTDKFSRMFSSVPAENTKDISVHLKNWQKSLGERGFTFENNGSASLISVVFHDQLDSDELFVGHTGILFDTHEGKLYFMEKLAFQEPYQLCVFESRAQLSDYLMKKYDTAYGQTAAAPMVLENAELIEGYRTVPENMKAQ